MSATQFYTGVIVSIGMQFGFIKRDDTSTDVFFHQTACEYGADYRQLLIGDRVRFCLKPSKSQPGKPQAGHLTREVKA